jgi:hypothetical protein
MTMFVYLDESGDAGFKFDKNSSRYFVVTLLLVDDPLPLQVAIDDLRKRLGFAEGNEFKFSSSSESVRRAFLQTLLHQGFTARALVVDKTLFPLADLRQREALYYSLVRLVLTHDEGTIMDAMLILDESVKSRKRKDWFTAYLRRALNTDPNLPKLRAVRYHASHTDNLVQAADMIAGAIYASYHRNDDSYLRIIRSKIDDLLEWRPGLSAMQ